MYVFLRENNKTLKIQIYVEKSSTELDHVFLDMTSIAQIGDLRKRCPLRFSSNGHFRIEREILHN
jgi:hypothetical protein